MSAGEDNNLQGTGTPSLWEILSAEDCTGAEMVCAELTSDQNVSTSHGEVDEMQSSMAAAVMHAEAASPDGPLQPTATYLATLRSAMSHEPSFVTAQSLLVERLRSLEEQLQASKSEVALHCSAALRSNAELQALREQQALAQHHSQVPQQPPLRSHPAAAAAATAAIAGTAAAAAVVALGRHRAAQDVEATGLPPHQSRGAFSSSSSA